MATLDELYRALDEADAAGDTEAAALFADEIRNFKPEAAPKRDVKAEYDEMPWYQKAGTAASDVLRLANKGLTLGWGDKLSALALSTLQGGDYDKELERQRGLTADASERAGSAALPAEVVGGMVTGNAASKVGLEALKAIPKSLPVIGNVGQALAGGVPQSLPLAGRLAGGAAVGAAEGSAYGAAQAAAEDRPIQEGVNEGLLFGALGGAGSEAISSLGNWLAARGANAAAPTLDELAAQTKAGYDRLENSGVELRPEAVSQLNENLQRDIANSAGGARRGSHPKIYGELDALQDYTPSIKDPVRKSSRTVSNTDSLVDSTTSINGGKPKSRRVDRQAKGRIDRDTTKFDTRPDRGMSLYDLEEHRKAIRRSTKDDPVERVFGNDAVSTIDDFAEKLTAADIKAGANVNVEDAVNDVYETRKVARRKIKLEEMGKEIKKGERTIDSNASADPSQVIRGRVKSILNNDKKAMGFTPDEIESMEGIVKGTTGGNIARGAAKVARGVGGQAMGAVMGAGIGNLLGGGAYAVGGAPIGLLAVKEGASGVLSKIAERSTDKQVEELLDLIARGGKKAAKGGSDAVGPTTRAELRRLMTLLGLEGEEANKNKER